jgi:hypothetical protein
VEMTLELQPRQDLHLQLGAAWLDAEADDLGGLPYLAEWNASFNLDYQYRPDHRAGLSLIYGGDRPDTNLYPQDDPDAFVLVNLHGSGRLTRTLSYAFGVNNLLDKRVTTRPGISATATTPKRGRGRSGCASRWALTCNRTARMHLPRRDLGRLPWLLLAGLVLAGGAVAEESAAQRTARVKAAFLLNISRYVEWPPQAFQGHESELRLCLLRDRGFKFEVQLLNNRWLGGRDAVVFCRPDHHIRVVKMSYAHLTQNERYQISALHEAGFQPSKIAAQLGRHKSTISRELARSGGGAAYQAADAQALADERRTACANGPQVSAETWSFVDAKLGEFWSPEQISGRLKADGLPTVSHESIYQRVYEDKQAGGDLHLALRCQKTRRKRYGSTERRGTIPNQTSIEARPAVVDTRERFGDWEGDLVIGAGQQGALVTLNERKSRFTLIAHVASQCH